MSIYTTCDKKQFLIAMNNYGIFIKDLKTGYINLSVLCNLYKKSSESFLKSEKVSKIIEEFTNKCELKDTIGNLYLLKNDNCVKIGRTFDIERRYSKDIRDYNTVRCILVNNYRTMERRLIRKFNSLFTKLTGNEWFSYENESEYNKILNAFDEFISNECEIVKNQSKYHETKLENIYNIFDENMLITGTYVHEKIFDLWKSQMNIPKCNAFNLSGKLINNDKISVLCLFKCKKSDVQTEYLDEYHEITYAKYLFKILSLEDFEEEDFNTGNFVYSIQTNSWQTIIKYLITYSIKYNRIYHYYNNLFFDVYDLDNFISLIENLSEKDIDKLIVEDICVFPSFNQNPQFSKIESNSAKLFYIKTYMEEHDIENYMLWYTCCNSIEDTYPQLKNILYKFDIVSPEFREFYYINPYNSDLINENQLYELLIAVNIIKQNCDNVEFKYIYDPATKMTKTVKSLLLANDIIIEKYTIADEEKMGIYEDLIT